MKRLVGSKKSTLWNTVIAVCLCVLLSSIVAHGEDKKMEPTYSAEIKPQEFKPGGSSDRMTAGAKQIKPETNETEDTQKADGHELEITVMFSHPNVVTGRVQQPLLSLPYTVSGPETYKYTKKDPYQSVHIKVQKPGNYTLKFDDLDLKERPITEEAKNEQMNCVNCKAPSFASKIYRALFGTSH